jgi:hypothetical protein
MRPNYKGILQYVHSENSVQPILKICRKISVFRQEGNTAERLLTPLCPSVFPCKPGVITDCRRPAGIFHEICNNVQSLQLPFGSNYFNEHFTRKQTNVAALISVRIRTLHACAVTVSFKCSTDARNRCRHKLSRVQDAHV